MPTPTQSIREIVTAEPSSVAVFERFEIDLCSRADAELERVCAEMQLSVEQVLEKLADAEAKAHGVTIPNIETYTLTRLIQHIVRTHHQTVRRELPQIVELSKRIAAKHGDRASRFKTVALLTEQLYLEMLAHLAKEEQMLFPYLVRLEEGADGHSPLPDAPFQSIAQPVSVMVREHDSVQGILAELRNLTNGFEPPEWACPRNIGFHASLASFEKDLHQHVHLENNLLFPRAIALETGNRERS